MGERSQDSSPDAAFFPDRTAQRAGLELFERPSAVAPAGAAAPETERRLGELSAELRAVRAAVAADALVLAKASHELRTPLSGIIGLAEILRHKAAGGWLGPAEACRLAGDIHASGVHLLSLVEALLDLSRLEYAERAAPATISVRDEVDCALGVVRSIAERKGIAVENGCDAALQWVADRRVFRQVAINLATNAVKFSPPGSTVRVAATCGVEALSLQVWDQGPGVDEGDRERILRPFGRGAAAEREGMDGVGLGLTIVAELLNRLGGRLAIERAEGGGSVFAAVLPAGRPAAQDDAAPGRAPEGVSLAAASRS